MQDTKELDRRKIMQVSRSTRKLVLIAVLALALGAMLVPTAQAEPFQQMMDCYAAHQLGSMAGTACTNDWTLADVPVNAPVTSETPSTPASDGFDFADAGVGAAVAVGGIIILGLLAAGALAIRRHQRPVSA